MVLRKRMPTQVGVPRGRVWLLLDGAGCLTPYTMFPRGAHATEGGDETCVQPLQCSPEVCESEVPAHSYTAYGKLN